MLHNALVAFAYLVMLLSPCAVAQWGHLLHFKFFLRIFMTPRERAVARLEDVRLEQEYLEGEFIGTYAPTMPPLPFAMPADLEAARASQVAAAMSTPGFADAKLRVAARLAQIVQFPAYVAPDDLVMVQEAYVAPAQPEAAVASSRPRSYMLTPPASFATPAPAEKSSGSSQHRSHTFDGTVFGMMWDSTAVHAPPISVFSPASLEKDALVAAPASEAVELERDATDLSEAA